MEEIKKNVINIVPMDNAGCGWYRLMQVGTMLQLYRHDVTVSAAAKFRNNGQNIIYTQRVLSEDLMTKLLDFKKQTGVKFIIDYDDLIWIHKGEGLPDYNLCRERLDCEANTEAMKKYLNELADHITVSTEELKQAMLQFVPEEKVTVFPNCLSYKDWYFPLTPAPKEDIFYYAGSYTHYDNVNKKPGDFDKNLIQYLSNKKVIVKSTVPYFIKPYKNTNGSLLTTYPIDFFKETRECKYILAPLADNVFNKCKSDLKYIESCAVGRVCLVSDFPGSPFEHAHPYQKIPVGSTPTAIKYIVERAGDHYDEILKHQYQFLNSRWLDNRINNYKNLLGLPLGVEQPQSK